MELGNLPKPDRGIFPYFGPGGFTIEDVREAIQGVQEFKESHEGDLVFFNYRWCNAATFPELSSARSLRDRDLFLLRRECRGLCFDKRSGKVVARRFHKFFNVGEREECSASLLDLNRPHVLLTKMDGSLVSPVIHEGKVRFATKSGFGPVSSLVEERFAWAPGNEKFSEWSRRCLEQGWTPLFEWCSLRSRVVLAYEKDMLVLLGLRHNETGAYCDRATLEREARAAGVPLTERIEGSKKADELLNEVRGLEGVEGLVMVFEDNGEMHKVKTEWYFARANKKEGSAFSVTSERGVWSILLNQQLDDAAPLLDPVLKGQMERFGIKLFEEVGALHGRCMEVCRKYEGKSKREFVEEIRSGHAGKALPAPLLYSLFDAMSDPSADTLDMTVEYCTKQTASAKLLEALKPFLGGLEFSEKVGPH